MKARIIKSLSGIYYAQNEHGTFECRARGILRKNNTQIKTGDFVTLSNICGKNAVIEDVLERKNTFIRPCVSNIDMIVYVLSVNNPFPNAYIIDKVTCLAEYKNVDIIIVLNKCDIDENEAKELLKIYSEIGYKVLYVSAKDNIGIDKLKKEISGKCAVFTGNTGVGKSSLLNLVDPSFERQTGDISQKLGRGRHTTRVNELFKVNDGYVIDTPGFGNLDITLENEIQIGEIQKYFKEFLLFKNDCRFDDCLHLNEDDCMVKKAVKDGKINESRYKSYVGIIEEFEKIKRY